jgi:hypothetical protein
MIFVETVPRMGKERIMENGEAGEFKYDIFDILKALLQMPEYTPTQHNNKKRGKKRNYGYML